MIRRKNGGASGISRLDSPTVNYYAQPSTTLDAGVPVPEAHLTPVPGSDGSNCYHLGGVDEDDWFFLFVLVVWSVVIVSLRCAGLCLANRWKQPAAPPQVVSGAVVGVAHGP